MKSRKVSAAGCTGLAPHASTLTASRLCLANSRLRPHQRLALQLLHAHCYSLVDASLLLLLLLTTTLRAARHSTAAGRQRNAAQRDAPLLDVETHFASAHCYSLQTSMSPITMVTSFCRWPTWRRRASRALVAICANPPPTALRSSCGATPVRAHRLCELAPATRLVPCHAHKAASVT